MISPRCASSVQVALTLWTIYVPVYGEAWASDDVFDIVANRLALMPEVAKVKWNERLPIEDLDRERRLIAGIVATVPAHRHQAVRAAIEAQIAASKQIQSTLFVRWQRARQPPFDDARNLATDLRPEITRLTEALVRAIVSDCPSLTGTAPDNAIVRDFPLAFGVAMAGIRCDERPLRTN